MRLKLDCGCNYNRSRKGSFQIISCKDHLANHVLSKLPKRELKTGLGLALNDIVRVVSLQTPVTFAFKNISKSRRENQSIVSDIPKLRAQGFYRNPQTYSTLLCPKCDDYLVCEHKEYGFTECLGCGYEWSKDDRPQTLARQFGITLNYYF